MDFKSMCKTYVSMKKDVNKIKVRRKIWPPNVHVLLGVDPGRAPVAVVESDLVGTMELKYFMIGMSLIMNEETAVFGWCPSIEDVMGQDWILIKGR